MAVKKIKSPFRVAHPILALGSHTKNTVCLLEGDVLYLAGIHADLSQLADYLEFEKTVRNFLARRPQVIAYDLHPEYQSSKLASGLRGPGYRKVAVQHHHAHIASCMLEHGLRNQKVIGVAFDGTGFGSDGTIWGGEFLCCNYKGFLRRGHIQEIPLLGGERAVLEPWRLAAAWLYRIYADRFLHLKIDFIKAMDKKSWALLRKMQEQKIYAPEASSMGRLFDAVASLVLNKHRAPEAALPMALEKLALRSDPCVKAYPFCIIRRENGYVLDPGPLFRRIIVDLKEGCAREKIAFRFHATVAEMIRKMCLILRKEESVNKVVLSGGVFLNKLLLSLACACLQEEGFRVFRHSQWSSDDSCVSLGQAAIAHFGS